VKRNAKKGRSDYLEFERETANYFRERQKRLKIIATTRTPGGQTLDWVPIESQVLTGVIASPPPESTGPILKKERDRPSKLVGFELEDSKAERGPRGTVPILRKDLTKLPRGRSLQDLLSKHGHSGIKFSVRNGVLVPAPGMSGHHYALTGQNVQACWGGEGFLSAFSPTVQSSGDFSLLQIGLNNSETGTEQTVEGGWQVMPQEYGDWAPHLFVFYTTNGYAKYGDNIGGYNRDVKGWVQYDSSIYPGAADVPDSIPGGNQYVMKVKYQWYKGNWWFQCNGRWIGYYPGSLFMGNQSTFSTLGDHATGIGFWGEVGDREELAGHGKTSTQMGSGYWPKTGWKWSAYMRNLLLQSDRSGGLQDYDGGPGWASDPQMYDILTHFKSGSNWGSYSWLGGPGWWGILDSGIKAGDPSLNLGG
jgi:hypothetical protein